MILFNKSFMNGASLFGIALTLTALGFLKEFPFIAKLCLFICAGLYWIASLLAFFFPKFSN